MSRFHRYPKRWESIRRRILHRDRFICGLCDDRTRPADTVDHIIPISKGGTHDDWNLRAAHAKCNYRKHNHMKQKVDPRRSRFDE